MTYTDTGQGLEARCLTTAGDTLFLRVDAYDDGVFRVRLGQALAPEASPLLVPGAGTTPEYEIIERPGEVSLITSELRLRIERAPLRLLFHGADGEPLTSEPIGEGFWCTTQATGETFELRTGESLFGFGQYGGPVNRRGSTVEIWLDSRAGRAALAPFVLSERSYGIFLNTPYRCWFDIGDSEHDALRFWHEYPGGIEYFFIHASSPEQVIARYTKIVGRPPLLPPWALGIWLAVETPPDSQALELVDEFRRRGLPLDVLIFSEPGVLRRVEGEQGRRFARSIAELSVHLGAVETPLVGLGVRRWREGLRRGYYAHNEDGSVPLIRLRGGEHSFLLDVTNPQAVDWWWQPASQWLKLGLEVLVLRASADPDLVADSRRFDAGPSGRELHNLFPLLFQRAVWERFSRARGSGVLMADAGFAGSQRYVVVCAGRGQAGWAGLSEKVRGGSNAGLAGFALWALGNVSTKNKPSPELYIRSLELSILSPVAYLGGSVLGRPPWQYGEDGLQAYRRFASLRMQLLPYLYNLAVEAHRTGLPIMRPVELHYPSVALPEDTDLEYLLGRDLLIAPITDSSRTGNGVAVRSVYLPEGEWYDFWSRLRLTGPRKLSYKADLGRVPLFVRAGAVIPLGPRMDFVGEKAWEPVLFQCYPGRATSWLDFWEPLELDSSGMGGPLACTRLRIAWGDTIRVRLEPRRLADGNLASARGVVLAFPEMDAAAVLVNRKVCPKLEDASRADGRHLGWALRRGDGLDLLVSLPADRTARVLEVWVVRK